MRIDYLPPVPGASLPADNRILIRVSTQDGSVMEVEGVVEQFNIDIQQEMIELPDVSWDVRPYKRYENTGRKFIQLSMTGAPDPIEQRNSKW